eukprot:SAG31_NODE_1235_length_9198_cov_5.065282_4_plen_57_part_00
MHSQVIASSEMAKAHMELSDVQPLLAIRSSPIASPDIVEPCVQFVSRIAAVHILTK